MSSERYQPVCTNQRNISFLGIFFCYPLTMKTDILSFREFFINFNIEFKGEIEMDDIFDAFDWEDMDLTGGMEEEFTEDEMELLRMGKDNDEWKNEDLDAFN